MTAVLLGIFVFLLAAIGAAVGSFLNVVTWRAPEKMSLVSPPSHCPKCNSPVRWFDNVPILSWFILRGRCRDCKEPISFRYPLVEALSCFVAAIVSWALLVGNWTGWNSQAFYWEDYVVWTNAHALAGVDDESRVDGGGSDEQGSYFDSLNFSPSQDGFLSLLRSTSILAMVWLLIVDVALMLGFVEWDRGYSPPTLLFAALVALATALTALFLINDTDRCLERSGVFIGSAVLGALGPVVCFPLLTRDNRVEHVILGAVWGVASGCFLAFPGSLVFCLVSFFLKRKLHKQAFGLIVFGGITILLLAECVITPYFARF